jgi:beta-carotene hydroxylase
MKPRFVSDYRLLTWMLCLPAIPVLVLLAPTLALYLLPVSIYLGYCTGVATHNQNHCPVFSSRRANTVYSLWLSVFYGYPIFAWIPTHNQNHHKHLNGDGDDTRTERYAPRNGLWYALSYPFASVVYQAPAIRHYIAEAARHRPRVFRQICTQYAVVALAHSAYLAAGVTLHGWLAGAAMYLLAFGLPAAFASWSMMFTNFLQHIECDPRSKDNHSRNFVDPLTNWLLFNAGYHTVHHENPGVHWSLYPALHEARVAAIKPELNQSTLVGYCFATYARPVLRLR